MILCDELQAIQLDYQNNTVHLIARVMHMFKGICNMSAE